MTAPFERLKQQADPNSTLGELVRQYEQKADEAAAALKAKQDTERKARVDAALEKLKTED